MPLSPHREVIRALLLSLAEDEPDDLIVGLRGQNLEPGTPTNEDLDRIARRYAPASPMIEKFGKRLARRRY